MKDLYLISPSVVHSMKKIVEMMLEGSDRCRIVLNSEGWTYQIIDARRYSDIRANFAISALTVLSQFEGIVLRVWLKHLLAFFKDTTEEVWVASDRYVLELRSGERVARINSYLDNVVYLNLGNYLDWPNFTINTLELSNVIMQLAVGGEYIRVTLLGSRLSIGTTFETGSIQYDAVELPGTADLFRVDSPGKVEGNQYSIKYLKQVCGIQSLCTRTTKVWLKNSSPIVIRSVFKSNIGFIEIIIAPKKSCVLSSVV